MCNFNSLSIPVLDRSACAKSFSDFSISPCVSGVGGTWHGQGRVRMEKTRSTNLGYPRMVCDSTFDNRR